MALACHVHFKDQQSPPQFINQEGQPAAQQEGRSTQKCFADSQSQWCCISLAWAARPSVTEHAWASLHGQEPDNAIPGMRGLGA